MDSAVEKKEVASKSESAASSDKETSPAKEGSEGASFGAYKVGDFDFWSSTNFEEDLLVRREIRALPTGDCGPSSLRLGGRYRMPEPHLRTVHHRHHRIRRPVSIAGEISR